MPSASHLSKPIAASVRVGHVHLKVADLDRALGFYRDVLGFEVTARYGQLGGVPVGRRLSPSYRPQHLGKPRGPVAGTRFDRPLSRRLLCIRPAADLGDALQARDWPPASRSTASADHGVSEALYLRDPDDNGVELTWDRPVADLWPQGCQWRPSPCSNARLDLDALLAGGRHADMMAACRPRKTNPRFARPSVPSPPSTSPISASKSAVGACHRLGLALRRQRRLPGRRVDQSPDPRRSGLVGPQSRPARHGAGRRIARCPASRRCGWRGCGLPPPDRAGPPGARPRRVSARSWRQCNLRLAPGASQGRRRQSGEGGVPVGAQRRAGEYRDHCRRGSSTAADAHSPWPDLGVGLAIAASECRRRLGGLGGRARRAPGRAKAEADRLMARIIREASPMIVRPKPTLWDVMFTLKGSIAQDDRGPARR